MEDYSRERHLNGGYEFVYTPHVSRSTLFEKSGHLGFYADGMYPPMEMDNGDYYPKPMNCPMHLLVFKRRQRSYRELPLDRNSVVQGKSGSVRVDIGGRRTI